MKCTVSDFRNVSLMKILSESESLLLYNVLCIIYVWKSCAYPGFSLKFYSKKGKQKNSPLRIAATPTWTCSCSTTRSGRSCSRTCSCRLCRSCRPWDGERRSWCWCRGGKTCRWLCWAGCWWICSSSREQLMMLWMRVKFTSFLSLLRWFNNSPMGGKVSPVTDCEWLKLQSTRAHDVSNLQRGWT